MLPVTAGRAVALATVPTMMFCLSPLGRAMADDYFDPAALEFADPQQQTSDLHYFAKPGGQQPGTYPVTVVVNDQELGQADITFVDDGGQLRPVLTARFPPFKRCMKAKPSPGSRSLFPTPAVGSASLTSA